MFFYVRGKSIPQVLFHRALVSCIVSQENVHFWCMKHGCLGRKFFFFYLFCCHVYPSKQTSQVIFPYLSWEISWEIFFFFLISFYLLKKWSDFFSFLFPFALLTINPKAVQCIWFINLYIHQDHVKCDVLRFHMYKRRKGKEDILLALFKICIFHWTADTSSWRNEHCILVFWYDSSSYS